MHTCNAQGTLCRTHSMNVCYAAKLFQSLFCTVVITTNINWKWPTVLQIPCRKPFCSQSNRARSVSGKVRWLAQAESCSAWHAQNVSTSLLCRGLLAIQIAGDMNGNNELLHNAAASFVTNFNSLKLGQFHDILDSRVHCVYHAIQQDSPWFWE